ncbi:LuxR family transcriptional regulator [Mycolicibacterium wolinskyi]|uniref:LuxR family transcriptional regulator n=1 Tax=Mycolicibacterium wolinskyi TaxID=59750 RepID=A0A132PQE5_9MYCO|nr:response regulator transcription factor [Mycolicibacterium wolinskyi]KWX24560.1 LuxR family transcriptional regulator [Mycolicibacterium wolinskyi]
MAAAIRVLIVDDQRLVRAGLRMLCESTPDLEVVGEAADGAEAARAAAELAPDVILMDLRMPGVDGITATRHVISARPEAKVLALTTFDDDDHLYPVLAAGAAGFLVKDTSPAELVDAIRRTAAGDFALSPHLLRRLVNRAVDAQLLDSSPSSDAVPLTPRELEVLPLVVDGLSNQEIADRLHLGVTTVKTHVANLMDKTGAQNRVQLAVYGCRRMA